MARELEDGDDMIEHLPLLTPEESRSAKTLARCHDRLAARRRKIEARNRPSGQRAVLVERLVVAGFCVAYLVAMADNLRAIAGLN
jgi:hypothetical protein